MRNCGCRHLRLFAWGEIMENGLDKSRLRHGIGLLSLLIILGTGSSYAKSSFKNTPLYRHVVKRRSSQSVKLYEKKPITSDEHVEAAEKSGNAEVKTGNKDNPATQASGGEPQRLERVPVVRSGPANLMDPSTFTPQMPLSEAVEILRNSTFPPLNIVVLWKDLEENADINPETPIGIDGVSGVSLSRHLKSLLDGVSGGSPERLGYVVDDGVIVISTLGTLPKRMVTRVYDVTDLVGQPSYGFPGFGFGMPGMGMMGGFGMPFGGGFGAQGGMMPGMGGMMPGLGGGFGNLGGGFGASPGLTGSPFGSYR